MSLGRQQSGLRQSVASRTAFDVFAVDSGEDTEEEEVELSAPETEARDGPAEAQQVKPTKTALRKAAKAAKQAKMQQKKDAKAAAAGTATPPVIDGDVSPVSTPAPLQPSGTQADPLPILEDDGEPPIQMAATLDAEELPTHPVEPEPTPNGRAPAAAPAAAAAPPNGSHSSEVPKPPKDVTSDKPVEDVKEAAEDAKQSLVNGSASSTQPDVVPPQPTPEEAERKKKRQNALERTVFGALMIGGFIALLLMGHAYMICLVMFCQTLVYREVTALFSARKSSDPADEEARKQDPWSKTLNWYFFAVANLYLYGESIIYYFKHIVFVDANLTIIAKQHRFISFSLYVMGFVGFVMSLKRGYLKQQFGLFCWVHMSLLMIVVSSHFIINNILEGLIWFWVPASLVICNDIFAYVWGLNFGRTPLIALSPKKTVEGFVGAIFSTLVFGVFWGGYFMKFDYMICPVHDLGVSAWSSVSCKPNPVFLWREAPISPPLSTWLSTAAGHEVNAIPYTQYHFHLLFLACFASLVAPFGGFFASGFKRAFNIKDFGHSIPGHGGMTDRMDCQFLMGVFTYVYYSSLIRESGVTVGGVLQTIVSGLTVDEQLELIRDLRQYLEGQGVEVVKALRR